MSSAFGRWAATSWRSSSPTAPSVCAISLTCSQKTGPMAEPLKDAAYFQRVFIEDGALTWPNGYDWDPIALHDEMKQAGLLRRSQAAE